jgi:hypothetical protein
MPPWMSTTFCLAGSFAIGEHSAILVAMGWTDFDADNQATIMLAPMSDHGRSTPLVWLTVDRSTLKDRRSFHEHRVLVRLAELLPAETKVCIVTDRGFGDQKLCKMLTGARREISAPCGATVASISSCRRRSASTSFLCAGRKDVDGWPSPAMTK